MKEYKYKINGNIYKVAIGDIEDNIAQSHTYTAYDAVKIER